MKLKFALIGLMLLVSALFTTAAPHKAVLKHKHTVQLPGPVLVEPINIEFYNSQNPIATTTDWQPGENEENVTYNSDIETLCQFTVTLNSGEQFSYSLSFGGSAGPYSISFPVDSITGVPWETVQAVTQ